METITSTDDTPIAYERTGSGPPLVLVHGVTTDHTTWREVLPFLEDHFTVYAMDRRGRGESGDADDYSPDREIGDVVALVESIDDPTAVLGHSFGATLALEAALRTDRLRGLALYEPTVVAHPSPDEKRALAEVRTAIDAGDAEEALRTFYREIGGLTETELERIQALSTWPRRVDAVHTVPRELAATHAYEFDPEPFRELRIPTLLLVGADSPPVDHRNAQAVDTALPQSTVALLADQRHVAYRLAPEPFATRVIDFLTDPP